MTDGKTIHRRRSTNRLQKIELALDRSTIVLARKLGNGNLALGLRRAVALATVRAGRG